MINASKNWVREINYLRAIAILGVLIIHTTDHTCLINKFTGLTFSLIYIEELVRFAVPMFVFVSGFVLHNKYKSNLPMKDFYKKRLLVILIPYLIFSVLYCIVNAYLNLIPALTLNSIISSIFNFNASGQFWFIKLILTFYIFYPAIIAYYEIIKDHFGIHTPTILLLSISMIYLFGLFEPSLKFTVYSVSPLTYLIYFIFGIYINDNYDLICQSLERFSIRQNTLLNILILIFPFFSMFAVVDLRCSTQFSNLIPYYNQLILISTHILHICIIIFCLHLLLVYKPNIRILEKIGEYSYGIFIIHPFFLNFLTICIFPRFSIYPTSLIYYIILFTFMLTMSYFTVKLMLGNCFTAYMITGRLKHYLHPA